MNNCQELEKVGSGWFVVKAITLRLTQPEVARSLIQTTAELADLLGISINAGMHKG